MVKEASIGLPHRDQALITAHHFLNAQPADPLDAIISSIVAKVNDSVLRSQRKKNQKATIPFVELAISFEQTEAFLQNNTESCVFKTSYEHFGDGIFSVLKETF